MAERLLSGVAALGVALAPAFMKFAGAADVSGADTDRTAEVECIAEADAPVHHRYRGTGDVEARLAKDAVVQVLSQRKNWRHIAYVDGGDAALGWITDSYLVECPDSDGTVKAREGSVELDSKPPDASRLRISTFNIQNFGKTKLGRPAVVSQLVSAVHKHSLVAVQELSDSSGRVAQEFLDRINEQGSRYGMLLSPRSGEQTDDQGGSQEQYAYYYDTSVLSPESDGELFDDSRNDYFQREPFVARFKSKRGGFTFAIATIHTTPGDIEEIRRLDDVVAWSRRRFPDEKNFVVLGDFNAGCSYASPDQLDELKIRNSERYYWVVPDDADTNLASKACAYDRIVVTTEMGDRLVTWGVDQAFSDKKVSDHWPVWAEFKLAD